jgi:hypothetical protein
LTCPCDHKIVDIYSHNKTMCACAAEVDGMFRAASGEPKLDQRFIQLGIPSTRSLAQSIQCLDKAQDLMFMPPEHKSRRLLDVDLFQQLAIQERSLDVHMMHCPALRGSKGEQQSDGL